MAIEPILSTVYLDVYDHDTTPTVIKAIASDKRTRFVQAYLQKSGEVYRPDPTATAYLIALRPDRSVVIGPAELVELEPREVIEIVEPIDGDGEPEITYGADAIYGPKAEITSEMTEVAGTIRMQFKIVQNNEELRTETFSVICGVNLENAGNCVIVVEK